VHILAHKLERRLLRRGLRAQPRLALRLLVFPQLAARQLELACGVCVVLRQQHLARLVEGFARRVQVPSQLGHLGSQLGRHRHVRDVLGRCRAPLQGRRAGIGGAAHEDTGAERLDAPREQRLEGRRLRG
jgi:hypothetical protein